MPRFADSQTIQVGDAKVTFLADGGGAAGPVATFPQTAADAWQPYGDLLDEDGRFITSIGGFLVERGRQKIVIDTGIGPNSFEFPGFGVYAGGDFLTSLGEAGVARDAVTDVVFTHLHLDHCGWTTYDAGEELELTLPNARHVVHRREWEFWHGKENPAGPDIERVQRPLEDRIHFIAGDAEVAPGLTVIETPGHTPGHISLRLTADGQTLYFIADLAYGVVQLQHPDWGVAFDVDSTLAQESREMLFPQLAQPNTLVAAGHFSTKVFGRVHRDGRGYRWEAL